MPDVRVNGDICSSSTKCCNVRNVDADIHRDRDGCI
jgi:hypothetical protein